MDLVKIQQELVKALSANDMRASVFQDEDNSYVTPDDYALYIIPNNEFWIDVNKIKSNEQLKKLMADETGYMDVENTETLRLYKSHGKEILLLQLEVEGAKIWFNRNLAKYFTEPVYKIKTGTKFALVYEGDKKVGMIGAYNYKNNEDGKE